MEPHWLCVGDSNYWPASVVLQKPRENENIFSGLIVIHALMLIFGPCICTFSKAPTSLIQDLF